MFSFITVALFVSLAIQGASAGFAINTPAMKQGTPVQISWAPGTSPYILDIVSAHDPCGTALQTIDDLKSTVYHLTPRWAPGTEVMLFVSDNAGDQAWSGNITIGSSDACTSGGSTISSSESSTVNPNTQASPVPTSAQGSPAASPSSNAPTFAQGSPAASSSSNTTALGGAINAGTSSGVLTVHRASLFSIMALAPILALTL